MRGVSGYDLIGFLLKTGQGDHSSPGVGWGGEGTGWGAGGGRG